MSADSYAVCPQCAQAGVVDLDADVDSEDATLREDYEIGMGVYPGEFFITYEGYCRVCGFHIEFHHRQNPLTLATNQDG